MKRKTILILVAASVATAALAALFWVTRAPRLVRAEPAVAYWAVCPQSPLNGCDRKTIQEAIDAAVGPEDIVIRVVGNNVYTENLVITKSLTLLGGCANATCTLRIPGILLTTIDGHGAGRAVTIEGEDDPITVTVDGFVVTGGDASSDARYPHSGGGVGSWNANLTLQRSVITDNVAERTGGGTGGGVYVYSGTVHISNNQVLGNQAGGTGGSGGGIALHTTSGQVSANLVQDNVAASSGSSFSSGGGVNIEECDNLVVTGNVIRDNTAAVSSPGSGGGISMRASTALTLTDNTIYANTGSVSDNGYGGGLYMYGSHAVLSGNTLRENVASRADYADGGGMEVSNSDVALDHNWIVSNTASLSQTQGAGGGLSFFTELTATLSGDIILSNTAPAAGNGIYIGSHVRLTATNVVVAKNHASGSSSAISVVPGGLSSTVTIVNSTVASNTYEGFRCSGSPTVTLVNLILWGNGNELACSVALSYSDVEDTDDVGTGVIHQNPLFVDAANDDFHLRAGSPCIDAGTDPATYPGVPDEDRDGESRPNGSGYDIGADEFWVYVYLPLALRNY